MTTLTFRTTSKTCPLRKQNGCQVVMLGVRGPRRKVRRLGVCVHEYAVRFPDGNIYWTYPDELHVEPEVTPC